MNLRFEFFIHYFSFILFFNSKINPLYENLANLFYYFLNNNRIREIISWHDKC